ncbi:hypothetical protein XCR1_1120035 [Xenorhabdus cabanillasii JM26]|uniref:Uncharacterized protein n=1 Tax=Xenorhabdus cabanillasii JM26 TaxID=1427517 RepID=W1ILR3_9GAMM|nr:hypothetical protein XCR1_1120035 [Xenorhabdus cabanillasii JM26]
MALYTIVSYLTHVLISSESVLTTVRYASVGYT